MLGSGPRSSFASASHAFIDPHLCTPPTSHSLDLRKVDMSLSRTFTREEIESRIAAGDTIVVLGSQVLRLNAWKEKHPGGRLVIEHMVGRDATAEISMYIIKPPYPALGTDV